MQEAPRARSVGSTSPHATRPDRPPRPDGCHRHRVVRLHGIFQGEPVPPAHPAAGALVHHHPALATALLHRDRVHHRPAPGGAVSRLHVQVHRAQTGRAMVTETSPCARKDRRRTAHTPERDVLHAPDRSSGHDLLHVVAKTGGAGFRWFSPDRAGSRAGGARDAIHRVVRLLPVPASPHAERVLGCGSGPRPGSPATVTSRRCAGALTRRVPPVGVSSAPPTSAPSPDGQAMTMAAAAMCSPLSELSAAAAGAQRFQRLVQQGGALGVAASFLHVRQVRLVRLVPGR